MTRSHNRSWKYAAFAVSLSAFVLVQSPSRAADEVTFVSAHIPPFSIKGGKRAGFVRDIVGELARRIGIPLKLQYANSGPAMLKLVRSRPNTMVFPLARTKMRDPHFVWVQKIREVPIIFASAPGKPKIAAIAQAKDAKAVGVRQGFAVRDLKKRGFRNLVIAVTSEENARALAAGRIDAWYAPRPEILYTWKVTDQKGQVVRGVTTRTIHTYIAASKNSPAIDVARWRAAFAAMKREGRIKAIIGSYLDR